MSNDHGRDSKLVKFSRPHDLTRVVSPKVTAIFAASLSSPLHATPLKKRERAHELKQSTPLSLSLLSPPPRASCREAKARKDETDVVRAVKRKQARKGKKGNL